MRSLNDFVDFRGERRSVGHHTIGTVSGAQLSSEQIASELSTQIECHSFILKGHTCES
jgi:hypothetical protein